MAERRPTPLLELVFAPTLWLLRDPSRRGTTRLFGVIMLLIGLSYSVPTAVSLPHWLIDIDNAKTTRGVPGNTYRRWTCTFCAMQVDGVLYEDCTGADNAFSVPALIAYDPEDPNRCRNAARLGRLSPCEWELVLTSLSGLAMGALLLAIRGEPRFTRGQVAAHAFLLLFIPFQIALAIFSYDLKHSSKPRILEPTQVFHGN